MSEKLWAGRFSKNTDRQVNAFNSSISFDWRMYRQDIRGSKAHAAMLAACGIISKEDADKICRGLEQIAGDLAAGTLEFDPEAEDVHMFIEAELTRRVGEAGKKLHTGRSRNDQVALDLRLYLRDETRQIRAAIIDLYYTLTGIASRHLETWMPGYTHMQRAQPISLAHHLMAYVEMFARDIGRLDDCLARMDVMPLGSGALAGTTYPLDREMVAAELGFCSISRNSLDAVADRDYAIEMAAALAIVMMHISRLSEELILWASQEFGFIELDDAYSTGSSIMPQKKNPDIAELSRGKTGRVYGDLTTLLTMMKGLPLAYNKDMQEDKEAIFDALDTVGLCLPAITGMVRTMSVNKDRLRQAAAGGFTNATDLADYLVAKGISFRDAHNISGQIVRRCVSEKRAIEALDLAALRQYSEKIGNDIYEAISLETCVRRRKLAGGPAPETVAAAILAAESRFR